MLKLGSVRFNQSQSRTLDKAPNGSPVLKYFLSETIHAQENGSRGPHFAKSLNSNFLKDLTYSAMVITLELRSVKFSTQLDLSQIKFTPSIVLNYSHVRICWRSNAANLWNCVILFSKYLRGINLPLNHAKGSHYVVRSPRQCFLRSNIWFLSKWVIFKTLPLVSKKF